MLILKCLLCWLQKLHTANVFNIYLSAFVGKGTLEEAWAVYYTVIKHDSTGMWKHEGNVKNTSRISTFPGLFSHVQSVLWQVIHGLGGFVCFEIRFYTQN